MEGELTTRFNEFGIPCGKVLERKETVRISITQFAESIETIELIETLINHGISELELKCVNRVDTRTYDVTLCSEESIGKMFEIVKEIHLGGNTYEVESAPDITWTRQPRWIGVTLFGVPFEIPDNIIKQKMQRYGEVEGINHQTFRHLYQRNKNFGKA